VSTSVEPDPDRLARAFQAFLRSHPDRAAATYGVHALRPNVPGEVAIELTFLAGEKYCCAEPGCHTGLYADPPWQRLRAALRAEGVEPLGAPLSVRIRAVTQPGARFSETGDVPAAERFEYTWMLAEPPPDAP
jgi:hypothetical protein